MTGKPLTRCLGHGGFDWRLIRHQGRISATEWNTFKIEALSLQSQDFENIVAAGEKRLLDGAKVDLEIKKRQLTDKFASNANSFTYVIDLAFDSEFGPVDAWCATKLLYTDRSIAKIYVYVPKDYPDALEVLHDLAQRISAPLTQ